MQLRSDSHRQPDGMGSADFIAAIDGETSSAEGSLMAKTAQAMAAMIANRKMCFISVSNYMLNTNPVVNGLFALLEPLIGPSHQAILHTDKTLFEPMT